ncbi:hypothetical protein ACQ4PT_044133 [Festuca glaucescens]
MDLGSDSEETWMPEIPTRETTPATMSVKDSGFLDALRRHREILRRETDFLREEVKSRGFATLAGKMSYYMESRSNEETVSPSPGSSELFASVGVSLPHLVTNPQESLDFLLHESRYLRYQMQSLGILRATGSSIPEGVKERLCGTSRTAMKIVQSMRHWSIEDATSSQSLHGAHWESLWSSGMESNGVFDDINRFSIYCIKIVELKVNLKWPLHVYGVVAARDTVDRNRNILFHRSRANCQIVTRDDPFLRLTGPSRAIVCVDHVTFEVELKIKYPGEERKDTLFCTYHWRTMLDPTPQFRGYAFAAELSLERLPRAIQATIVGVRLVKGSWSLRLGCRISCSLFAAEDPTPREVELLNCSPHSVRESHIGSGGYFCLARNVVSVQMGSTLRVDIEAKADIEGKAKRGGQSYVEFPVQYCQTSRASCYLVNCEVEVVVAWFLLVENERDLML